jgi:hypothetical protein
LVVRATMSRKNGDGARSDRQRKEKIHKRARSAGLRKALQERTAAAGPSKGTSKSVA